MNSKYLHLSVFFGAKQRHGGTKRSDQLVELLSSCDDIESVNPYIKFKDSLKIAIIHPFVTIESVLFFFYFFLFKGLSFKGWIKFSIQAINPISLIKKNKPEQVYLETAPGISLVLMKYLKWKKIQFIAIPHNIEFMVPNQNPAGFVSLGSSFDCEVDGYKAAAQVWVIGEYDRSVLNCIGIDSLVLPYYPTGDDEKFFLSIREQRSISNQDKTLLLLGTVGNIPTYNGVFSLLNEFDQGELPYKIIVAGYGTEQFASFNSERITIVGSVDQQELKKLLISCSALVINQPQTTGFLTKIIEFNLCGIPIVVTSDYLQADGLESFGIIKANLNNFEVRPVDNFFKKPEVNMFMSK